MDGMDVAFVSGIAGGLRSKWGGHRVCGAAAGNMGRVVCARRGGRGEKRRQGDGRRPNRVGEMIRRELGPLIDDAFARSFSAADRSKSVLVSVIDVKCSEDLRNARVSVSVLGSEEDRVVALAWLKGWRKELRFELAQCIRLKYVPDLVFTESEVAQAVKTVNIIDMLARERELKMNGAPEAVFETATEDGLDLDASDEDAIIGVDGDESDAPADASPLRAWLEEDHDDEIDDADDALIIDVDDVDDAMDEMSDDQVRRLLFKSMNEEDSSAR